MKLGERRGGGEELGGEEEVETGQASRGLFLFVSILYYPTREEM